MYVVKGFKLLFLHYNANFVHSTKHFQGSGGQWRSQKFGLVGVVGQIWLKSPIYIKLL